MSLTCDEGPDRALTRTARLDPTPPIQWLHPCPLRRYRCRISTAEDAYTAYRRISDNATGLGLDPTRVGLAGQSGGGGIAAATALLIRERGAVTRQRRLLRNTSDGGHLS